MLVPLISFPLLIIKLILSMWSIILTILVLIVSVSLESSFIRIIVEYVDLRKELSSLITLVKTFLYLIIIICLVNRTYYNKDLKV